jgi:hypothetical protein
VLQHFIHCLATHGRHVQYLNFLHTIIKAEGKYVKKCQDMIMTEVRQPPMQLALNSLHWYGILEKM